MSYSFLPEPHLNPGNPILKAAILTYHSQNVAGNDTANNDHVALAADLDALHAAGCRFVSLTTLVDIVYSTAPTDYGSPLVCLTFDDGCDYDVRSLEFPGHGIQPGLLQLMESFVEKHGSDAQPGLHATSFVIASPEARRCTARGIEVGQIFYFGTKYSEAMGANVQGPDGKPVPVHMGSHGIGVSRLVGAIIEASHDDKGIIWPESVTPYHVGIINVKQGDDEADTACEAIYKSLKALGLDPLYDDRKERAGGKFATMDLIGLPWRITVGPRGLKNGVVELTCRRTGDSEELPPEQVVEKIAKIYAGL